MRFMYGLGGWISSRRVPRTGLRKSRATPGSWRPRRFLTARAWRPDTDGTVTGSRSGRRRAPHRPTRPAWVPRCPAASTPGDQARGDLGDVPALIAGDLQLDLARLPPAVAPGQRGRPVGGPAADLVHLHQPL